MFGKLSPRNPIVLKANSMCYVQYRAHDWIELYEPISLGTFAPHNLISGKQIIYIDRSTRVSKTLAAPFILVSIFSHRILRCKQG